MSIVLNEIEWAKNAIAEERLGKKPTDTLLRVAKYYLHEGLSKQEARRKLEEFLIKCDPSASITKWSGMLDKLMKSADKYPPMVIDGIDISREEMSVIDSIPSKLSRRLAFTLLCAAKYLHIANPNLEYWVSIPDKEIMSMANINTSIKRQSMLFGQLKSLGHIRFSKKIDSLSVQVLFVGGDDTVLRVTDFRNLGFQYLMFHGDPFFKCENCGITCKCSTTSKKPKKYCDSCAVKIKMKKNIDSVMRIRNSDK